MTSTWIDIPGYEGYYQINQLGSVRSVDRYVERKDGRMQLCKGVTLKPFNSNKCFYNQVQLCVNNQPKKYMIHRLMGLCFLGLDLSSDLEINHIDGDRHNNQLTNLEVVTHQQNITHSVENHLKHDVGEENSRAKISNADAVEIRRRWRNGERQVDIAKDFGVTNKFVWRIVHYQGYKNASN